MADLQYKNYIFDFYGTLVDIWKDEENEKLWEQMAALYATYGADYSAAELKANYDNHIKRQENQLRKRSQLEHVEVDLVVVFIELLLEAPHKHATDSIILDLETWGNLIAQTFRMLSRKKLQTYENTLATLKTLKEPQVDLMNLVLNDNQLNPEETVMVGNDFTSDMAIAQAAGIDGILLNTFPYNQSEIETLNTMNAKVIEDISELVVE